ncbi:MAG: rhodanese-like domain-containing protein [Acidimicrobiales bacterium]|nr:rhodanese-like domain-containing protein [Acidimicrobiales bacterium]
MEFKFFNRSSDKSLEVSSAKELIDNGELVVVDVREPHEFHSGHIEKSIHIPLASLEKSLHLLPKDVHLLVVCRSGMRSSRACSMLLKNGHKASNLKGGLIAWINHGYLLSGG